MAKVVTEFIGTFFLILAISCGALVAPGWHPFVIGLSLALMVYMGGSISGAQFNPAVTLGVRSLGKMPAKDVAPYIGAQILAGISAMTVGYFIQRQQGIVGAASGSLPSEMFAVAALVEFIFTFMLMLVILNVAATDRTKGNSFYGLAIGGAVVVGASIGGPVSGGAFNPAVGIAVAFNRVLNGGSIDIPLLLIHIILPIAGVFVATKVFAMQEKVLVEIEAK